jgi:hypothetical protein
MAEPTVQQLVDRLELREIRDIGVGYIDKVAKAQRKRTGAMYALINEASFQYLGMRQDITDALLRDKGPPTWLNLLLTAGMLLLPVNALSGAFLATMSKVTNRMVSRPLRLLKRSQQQTKIAAKENVWNKETPGTTPALRQERKENYQWDALARRQLAKQIKLSEAKVADFARIWQPELAAKLRQIGNELMSASGKTMLPRLNPDDLNKKLSSTNTPLVQVRLILQAGVKNVEDAEDKANELIEEELDRLYKTAVYLTDAWTRDKGMDFPSVSGELGPGGYIRSKRDWDKKAKEVKEDLKALVRDLEPDDEDLTEPPRTENMLDIMTMIEACMWCVTYDFSIQPMYRQRLWNRSETITEFVGYEAPPLPDTTWEQLVKRYTDPEAGKPFKEVVSSRLGTATFPISPDLEDARRAPAADLARPLPTTWPPKLRLSFFFSRILYPVVNSEILEFSKIFSKLHSPPPPVALQPEALGRKRDRQREID